MSLYDRIRASFGYVPRPPAPERETCESESHQELEAAIASERACKVCGDPEDYCVECDQCKKPIYDKHRTEGEYPVCLGCAI